MTAQPYPIDVADLAKGDWIPPDRVSECMGVDQADPKFPFARLTLREFIRSNWCGENGERVEVRQDRDGLLLIPDAEVAEYNAKRRERAVRDIAECVRRITVCVDDSKLDDRQRREKEHEAHASATLALFMTKARKQLAAAEPKALE